MSYPFLNVNGAIIELCLWIGYVIPYIIMHAIIHTGIEVNQCLYSGPSVVLAALAS